MASASVGQTVRFEESRILHTMAKTRSGIGTKQQGTPEIHYSRWTIITPDGEPKERHVFMMTAELDKTQTNIAVASKKVVDANLFQVLENLGNGYKLGVYDMSSGSAAHFCSLNPDRFSKLAPTVNVTDKKAHWKDIIGEKLLKLETHPSGAKDNDDDITVVDSDEEPETIDDLESEAEGGTGHVAAKPTAEVAAKPTAEVAAKPTAEVAAKPTAEVAEAKKSWFSKSCMKTVAVWIIPPTIAALSAVGVAYARAKEIF